MIESRASRRRPDKMKDYIFAALSDNALISTADNDKEAFAELEFRYRTSDVFKRIIDDLAVELLEFWPARSADISIEPLDHYTGAPKPEPIAD